MKREEIIDYYNNLQQKWNQFWELWLQQKNNIQIQDFQAAAALRVTLDHLKTELSEFLEEFLAKELLLNVWIEHRLLPRPYLLQFSDVDQFRYWLSFLPMPSYIMFGNGSGADHLQNNAGHILMMHCIKHQFYLPNFEISMVQKFEEKELEQLLTDFRKGWRPMKVKTE